MPFLPSNVGFRLQFTVYGFSSAGGGFSLPRGCAGLFSEGGVRWVEEPRVVPCAYLYLLEFHVGSFGASCPGEIALLFSVWCRIGRLSMG
jgi:hypothetical protein